MNLDCYCFSSAYIITNMEHGDVTDVLSHATIACVPKSDYGSFQKYSMVPYSRVMTLLMACRSSLVICAPHHREGAKLINISHRVQWPLLLYTLNLISSKNNIYGLWLTVPTERNGLGRG